MTTVETLTAERDAWRRGAMLLLDELGDYESGSAPHIRVRRLRMKLKSISDTNGGLQMLLRSWLACMQEPRPKDWEDIAANLITDSRKFLDEKTDPPDNDLIDRVLQIMGDPGITEITYAKLKAVLAGRQNEGFTRT